MPKRPSRKSAIFELVDVMRKLRAPKVGCPWDLEQNHLTLRRYAIEEVYELIDAIESGDDAEMAEELGDLLLQVVFHCQLAAERRAFTFEKVSQLIVEKLIRRHPHVFGPKKLKDAAAVLAQWDHIKRAEKQGTRHERPSVLDGIPKHLPALMRAEKLLKKAGKAGLPPLKKDSTKSRKSDLAQDLFQLVEMAQKNGWSAENLLRTEIKRRERLWRKNERRLRSQP